MKALGEYLQQELVRSFHEQKPKKYDKIIDVTTKTTFSDAMHILAENNVLSLPVRDADEVSYVGWFGVMEALSFVLRTYTENEDKENKNWTIWCKDIDKLMHKGEIIGKVPIEEVMDKKMDSTSKWDG